MIALALTVAAALGCGLMAGTFFAFSSFIMPALGDRPVAEAIGSMQRINVRVLNRSFLGTFLGTAAVCVALAWVSLESASETGSIARLVGSGLYLIGTLGVTILCNVPRNDQLAEFDPSEPGAPDAWGPYLRQWTRWNTVRTVAALGAMAALMLSLHTG